MGRTSSFRFSPVFFDCRYFSVDPLAVRLFKNSTQDWPDYAGRGNVNPLQRCKGLDIRYSFEKKGCYKPKPGFMWAGPKVYAQDAVKKKSVQCNLIDSPGYTTIPMPKTANVPDLVARAYEDIGNPIDINRFCRK